MVKLAAKTDPVSFLFPDLTVLRIIRLLSANDSSSLEASQIAKLLAVKTPSLKKSLESLKSAGVVKEIKRKKSKAYRIDTSSPLVSPLQELLRFNYENNKSDLAKEFKVIKGIKKLILSGNITDNSRSEVDVIVVGKALDEKKLEALLKQLGFKTGFEVSYMTFTPEEFDYRLEMNDRLLRNIVDFQHFFVIGKL